jgi:hypothetical protein
LRGGEILSEMDDAVKTANAIKIFISRLAKSKGYYVDAVIGVSENDVHSGKFIYEKNGKKGRPKKKFHYKKGYDKSKKPELHIHVVLHANPGDMVANRLMGYLNKKFVSSLSADRKSVCMKTDCTEYKDYEYEYVINQSSFIRKVTVGENPDALLEDDLQQEEIEIQEINEEGFIFTKSNHMSGSQRIDFMTCCELIKERKKMVCNIPIYLYSREQYRYLIIDIIPP